MKTSKKTKQLMTRSVGRNSKTNPFTKKGKSAAALKRLKDAETKYVTPTKFGLGKKRNPDVKPVKRSREANPKSKNAAYLQKHLKSEGVYKPFVWDESFGFSVESYPLMATCKDLGSGGYSVRIHNGNTLVDSFFSDMGTLPSKLGRALKANRQSNPKKTRRTNPMESAADMFETFHGVPSKEVIEFATKFHIHEHLAGLGRLTELVFFTPGAKPEKVTLEEEDLGEAVWLCSSEDGKQLYILGDVTVDLEQLGYREDVDVKDAVELGRLTNVVYRTQKEFHELKMLDYDHRLGKRERWQTREGVGPEMNKAIAECPILAYHPLEHHLSVIGGQYLILEAGISN